MYRLLVAAVAGVFAIAFAPTAAAQSAPPSTAFIWGGFYIGGNIGYSWGNADTSTAGNATNDSFPLSPNPITNNLTFFGGDHKQDVDGIVGGGQFGYNYQINPWWVLGIETDIQGSAQQGSNVFSDSIAGSVCGTSIGGVCVGTSPLNGAAVTNLQAKILWFGTVRGRVGWLVTDQILLYATGGLAYGQVSVSGDLNTSASAPSLGLKWGPGTNAFSASNTNVGFAVGGGLEGKFTGWLPPNWSWKLEYLYLDLGSLDTSTPFVAQSNAVGYSDTTGTMTTHTRFTDHIVRVGLNFQFNPETISRTR